MRSYGMGRCKVVTFNLAWDRANDVLVSAAAGWEIEVKRAAGRAARPDLLDAIGHRRPRPGGLTAAGR